MTPSMVGLYAAGRAAHMMYMILTGCSQAITSATRLEERVCSLCKGWEWRGSDLRGASAEPLAIVAQHQAETHVADTWHLTLLRRQNASPTRRGKHQPEVVGLPRICYVNNPIGLRTTTTTWLHCSVQSRVAAMADASNVETLQAKWSTPGSRLRERLSKASLAG